MKIALVKSPWWVRYCPPYILAFFSTYLRGKGHEVSLFDLNNTLYHKVKPELKKYWDDRDYYSVWENPAFIEMIMAVPEMKESINSIIETNTDIICFTTHTPNTRISEEIARNIKQENKEKIIVFLGHKCSRAQMAYDFASRPYIDYVCTGEAEIALCNLVEKLKDLREGDDLPECDGFLLKRNGKIVDCGNPPVVDDLDSLPFPDYEDFTDDIEKNTYSQAGRLDILDSRGCINACHFCYERLYWQKFRTMSGSRIYEQIKYHTDSFPQVNYFYFNGLLLNADLKVLEEFCDLVIDNDMKITWAGQAMIRADMTGALLKKMRSAGCVWLGYGVESGSQSVLRSMNKRLKVSDAVNVLKDTHDAGISIQINIMIGFPGETEDDLGQTLEFVKQVRPYIDNILASQSFCTLEKETYMCKNPAKFGITGGNHHLYWKSDGGSNNYAERFRRYEEFCKRALRLGVPETSGVLLKKPDKWVLLGDYYYFEKDYARAAECYEMSIAEEFQNKSIYKKLARAYEEVCNYRKAIYNYNKTLEFKPEEFGTSGIDVSIKAKIKELEQKL
ncbi:radical SAM protein [Elusimicrobiota bacterium]